MEADLDIFCLIESPEKRRVIRMFLERDTRPLLVSQVDDEHKNTFNVLDNLSSVEASELLGDDGLALSWFLGGGDWFTEAEVTLKDLASAGADQIAAALWVDGQIHNIFRVTDQNKVEIVEDIDEDLLEQIGDEEGPGVFDFLRGVLRS